MKKLLTLALVMAVSVVSIAAATPSEVTYEKQDVRYFLRRDDCGGADNPHLALIPGPDSEGCAFVAGPANEVLYQLDGEGLEESWPQDDAKTYLIDHEGKLRGRIETRNFLAGALSKGYLIVDVRVEATRTNFFPVTLADFTIEEVLTAAPHVIDFETEIDDALAGQRLANVTVFVRIRGVTTMHTAVRQSGASHITLPTLVEVPAA